MHNRRIRLPARFFGAFIAMVASVCHAQYTTDWLANTYGTLASHVGNAARSMWVAPEGVVYTASMWDENEGGVEIYQNGRSIGSIGIHSEFQGGAITGNTTSIFAAMQAGTQYGSGGVGRYNRATGTRDLVINVSTWNASDPRRCDHGTRDSRLASRRMARGNRTSASLDPGRLRSIARAMSGWRARARAPSSNTVPRAPC